MKWAFDDAAALRQRIRGEFKEMPGLRLTSAQAAASGTSIRQAAANFSTCSFSTEFFTESQTACTWRSQTSRRRGLNPDESVAVRRAGPALGPAVRFVWSIGANT